MITPMKKILISLFLFFGYNLSCYTQVNTVNVFLNPKYKGYVWLYSNPKVPKMRKIKNTYESYWIFAVQGSKDNMFLVNAQNTELISGVWIKKSPKICVYAQHYPEPYLPLYDGANLSKEIYRIDNYPDRKACEVLDIKDSWVKVRIKYNGKCYIGWLAPWMQCANPYSTCN